MKNSQSGESGVGYENRSGFAIRVANQIVAEHNWVTVINPSNQRLLLQACDNCGVVKSENSVVKACRARKGRALISNSLQANCRLVS